MQLGLFDLNNRHINEHKLIRGFEVTSAEVHDSNDSKFKRTTERVHLVSTMKLDDPDRAMLLDCCASPI